VPSGTPRLSCQPVGLGSDSPHGHLGCCCRYMHVQPKKAVGFGTTRGQSKSRTTHDSMSSKLDQVSSIRGNHIPAFAGSRQITSKAEASQMSSEPSTAFRGTESGLCAGQDMTDPDVGSAGLRNKNGTVRHTRSGLSSRGSPSSFASGSSQLSLSVSAASSSAAGSRWSRRAAGPPGDGGLDVPLSAFLHRHNLQATELKLRVRAERPLSHPPRGLLRPTRSALPRSPLTGPRRN
jgi:hypothetical protein